MAIETLEDIVEEIADQLGIYGVHNEEDECFRQPKCRCCFTFSLRQRIENAVEIEQKLARGKHHG